MEVLPFPLGSNAKPTRGPKLFLSVLGSPKVITPGTLEIALRVWVLAPTGLVQYSYRRPKFKVSRGVTLKSSCTNQLNKLWVPRKLPVPALRSVLPGLSGRRSLMKASAVLYWLSLLLRGRKNWG